MADTTDSKSVAERREGSSPFSCTKIGGIAQLDRAWVF